MREIGSEFWWTESRGIAAEENNTVYVLSGRTALDFIIRDINSHRVFNSVLLPSYCCDSMIEPFIRNGVGVKFYQVDADSLMVECDVYDAILLLDYFGYIDEKIEKLVAMARMNGSIVIYDSTHYLGKRNIDADYYFCSYRKWFYSNAAVVKKMSGEFCIGLPNKCNKRYIELRDRAAKQKVDYIKGITNDKQPFLQLFSEAEEILEVDYVDYAGIPLDFDLEVIKKCRRRNALRLIAGLSDISEIKIWKSELGDEDIPLFVPIFISYEIRNELRKFLIAENIYCPIHWPVTDLHGEYREIFDRELSLICDQRYFDADIDYEIEAIRRFFEGRK